VAPLAWIFGALIRNTTTKLIMGQSASKAPSKVEENKSSVTQAADCSAAAAAADSTPSAAPSRRKPDKLRDGPCASVFADLEKCASEKGITEHAVSCA